MKIINLINKSELKNQLSAILDSDKDDDAIILELEQAIANQKPYNHDEDDIKKAINIKEDINFSLARYGSISETTEYVEKSTSKRKLALILTYLALEKNKKGPSPLDYIDSNMSKWIKNLYR